MARGWISLTLVIAFSGCEVQKSAPANENAAGVPSNETAPSATPPAPKPAPPQTIEPGEPGGLPDDRTLIEEGNIDPKSEQGAGQIVQRFGGLLEQQRFADARDLWSDDGKASGLTEAEFVAAYEKYAEIHSEVGRPGNTEGAAGSIYVDVPFRLYGKLKTGKRFNLVGPVTLRRVNDVPGSTLEQRRWHIYRTDLNSRS